MLPLLTPNATAASPKPNGIIIASTDVFEQLGGRGTKMQQLRGGIALALVKNEQS
jgi:hypothetical protein